MHSIARLKARRAARALRQITKRWRQAKLVASLSSFPGRVVVSALNISKTHSEMAENAMGDRAVCSKPDPRTALKAEKMIHF
jgi:hypothetical protein